ncbi:hypothetical protein LCGC14_0729480 [marine sediment metagenome]|uniref:dTMP kinase n=1 Tax=marine sediment metagenome TaxID=412755 RepID=A0A0F9SVA1_9ZZZZ
MNPTNQQEQPKQKGKFIVFEGPDGMGKSKQSQLALDYLIEERVIDTVLTKEPGSSLLQFTGDLREMIFHRPYSSSLDQVEQGLLLFIDHYHNARWVRELTDHGRNVISDKWLYSQYCYNSIKPVSQETAMDLYEQFEPLQIQPDLVIIMGLDKEEAYRRIEKREKEGEKKTQAKHKLWAVDDYIGELIKNYATLYHGLVNDEIPTITVVPKNEETPEEVFEKYIKGQINLTLEGE